MKRKRFFSALMAVCMILSLFPPFTLATAYEGACGAEENGDSVVWTLDDDGLLTIYGTGAMQNYEYTTDMPWYYQRGDIRAVEIQSGVTSIGNWAFYDCDALTSVTIPDSVTEIGYNAFQDCDALTSVTIPGGVTSIGNWAFYDCDALTSATLPDGLTFIGDHAFYDCDALTSRKMTITLRSFSVRTALPTGDTAPLVSLIPGNITPLGSHNSQLTGTATLQGNDGNAVEELESGQEEFSVNFALGPYAPDALRDGGALTATADVYLVLYDDAGLMLDLQTWPIELKNAGLAFAQVKKIPPELKGKIASIKIMFLSEDMQSMMASNPLL